VVGKAVLIANATRSIRRYDRAPLMRPILFKAAFYWAVVFVARLVEHWIRFWLVEHHPLGTFLPHMVATFDWHRFIAIQLWILVLFLIYETATELNHLFGEGELWHLLVTSRPSELPLDRRQRIPRARPAEQACGYPLNRRIPRSDQHRPWSISRYCAPDRRGIPRAHLDGMKERVVVFFTPGHLQIVQRRPSEPGSLTSQIGSFSVPSNVAGCHLRDLA
jgi:hypothetical protein